MSVNIGTKWKHQTAAAVESTPVYKYTRTANLTGHCHRVATIPENCRSLLYHVIASVSVMIDGMILGQSSRPSSLPSRRVLYCRRLVIPWTPKVQ